MSDPQGFFTRLDPPPGGAERLRKRMREDARETRMPVRRPLVAASAAVLVVCAAAVVLVLGHRETDREPDSRVAALSEAPQFDRLLGRPLERTQPSVSVNERSANVVEIHTAAENIRIYQIE